MFLSWSFGNPELKVSCTKIIKHYLYLLIHCNENPIYKFPEKELCRLSLNFHIHVAVSGLYIPWIGPHFLPAAE